MQRFGVTLITCVGPSFVSSRLFPEPALNLKGSGQDVLEVTTGQDRVYSAVGTPAGKGGGERAS